jgi:lipoyl(octanoyl) transferase
MKGSKVECRLLDLGLIEYQKALTLQKTIVAEVISKKTPNTLILCEHPHVITFGRRAKHENLLASKDDLQRMGVKVSYVDRGGDVTYHGPGQVLLYPIFDLRSQTKDLHLYLRKLEEVVIRSLKENFTLNACRKKGITGVCVGPYKVASIGIGVRHWVTYHGLALNVKARKDFFKLIRPCGRDVPMASINDFFDEEVTVQEMKGMLAESVKNVFNMKVTGG